MVIFETHDNGGRAFRVKIFRQEVTVDRITYHEEDSGEETKRYVRVTKFDCLNHWIGAGVTEFSWGPQETVTQKRIADLFSRGNACLFQKSQREFVFVGACMISFQLPRGETFQYFESVVGNNDVPYPWMATEKNVYFLVDEDPTIPYVALKHFIGSKDFYSTFYGHDDRYKKEEMKQWTRHLPVKILAERQ